MNKIKVNGFGLSTGTYASFIDEIIERGRNKVSGYVCVANVHMFIESYRDNIFRQVVEGADIVTPDGKPLCWYLKWKHGIVQERVAGMDLLPDLLARMEKEQQSVFFYGGSQDLLDETGLYLHKNYPALQVAGLYSPPFRALTDQEQNEIVNKINLAKPSIVFVILGCPRQEKWMAGMKGKIQATMIGVGGALPVLTGMQKRAPTWMQKFGLEWLYRLLQEPTRLFKRYAITNTYFIYLLTRDLLAINNSKKLFKQ
jgi:N-acetylglucosaminyldiphosphoundecaprenol N-acetyl-beta-D-mannosaminyltransferase